MRRTDLQHLTSPVPGGTSRPGQTRYEGPAIAATQMARGRILMAGAAFCGAFAAVGWKLVDVTLLQEEAVRARRSMPVSPVVNRAEIIDRNGVVLATKRPVQSAFADPSELMYPRLALRDLARIFPGMNQRRIWKRLNNKRKKFVWLQRELTERQAARVIALDLKGVGLRQEWRRTWPHGAVTGHIVGLAGHSGQGLAGIELKFNTRLAGGGKPLMLSIDLRVQMALRDVLSKTVRKFGAIGGSALMMDVRNGEILGMVSLPEFEPEAYDKSKPKGRFNRNTKGVYEMGSTFKIFTVALALEHRLYPAGEKIDARKPLKVRKYQIRDYHAKNRWLTLEEVFQYSSNIGAARIATRAGRDRLTGFLRKLGLMSRAPLELPEIGAPILPRHWRPVHTMTISFGHGMAVSPVQLAAAVAAVVNGGIWHPPTLLRRPADARLPGRRVLSPATSRRMRQLLRLVVEKGTGRKAEAPGYEVGGKTGSAEKAGKRGYRRKKLLSSFVGVFPISKPRYVVFVAIDEPNATKETNGYATGGWVAAPAVKEIILRTAPIVGLRPNRDGIGANVESGDPSDGVDAPTGVPDIRGRKDKNKRPHQERQRVPGDRRADLPLPTRGERGYASR